MNTASSASSSNITMEDLLKLWNQFKETMPKEKIDAVLVTDDETLIPARCLRTSYEGKEYFILLKKEFEKIVEQAGVSKSEYAVPYQGSLGALLGIPVYEDTALIRDIIIFKFKSKYMQFSSIDYRMP